MTFQPKHPRVDSLSRSRRSYSRPGHFRGSKRLKRRFGLPHAGQQRRMDATAGSQHKPLGFVSVRKRSEQGYFGGYLIVNATARPLEFHCTVPVQPTRAQSILFGNTLEEFLCGEQITRALLAKAKLLPDAILVDTPTALCARHWFDVPILWLSSDESARGSGRASQHEHGFSIPEFHRDPAEIATRCIGEYRFACLGAYEGDLQAADQLFENISSKTAKSRFEFDEPFERIVEALSEAHPRSKAG